MKDEVRKKIFYLPIGRLTRLKLLHFFSIVGIDEKKEKTFLNFENDNQSIGFLYRLIITNAYKYNVPKVYINECVDIKRKYDSFKKQNKHKLDSNKDVYILNTFNNICVKLYTTFNRLMDATIELYDIKNSRKNKIQSLLEKIYDKNN